MVRTLVALGPWVTQTWCVPRIGCTSCEVFAVYARACTDALVLGTSGHWWGSAEVGEEPVAGGGGRRFDRRTEEGPSARDRDEFRCHR